MNHQVITSQGVSPWLRWHSTCVCGWDERSAERDEAVWLGGEHMRLALMAEPIVEPHTTTTVTRLPHCDFCRRFASYDAKTVDGPWAYQCERHYAINGVGLGLGVGQRLIVKVGQGPLSPDVVHLTDKEDSDEQRADR